jgi:ubiquinone/menaquinone biosynthesis C-methylase UbiE
MSNFLKRPILYLLFLAFIMVNYSKAQDIDTFAKPYPKKFKKIQKSYSTHYQYLNVKQNEKVANIGSGDGHLELTISLYTDSIQWTLQDIDSFSLNQKGFLNRKKYYEALANKPISGEFILLMGTDTCTGLKKGYYDRIIISNAFHEFNNQLLILKDISLSLKTGGMLLISEKMGKKEGEIRKDCHYPKIWEPDLINGTQLFGLEMVNRILIEKKSNAFLYSFQKKI